MTLIQEPERSAAPVIVRVASVNLEQPSDRQRRTHFVIGEDRLSLIAAAVSERLRQPTADALMLELVGVPDLMFADVVVRRSYGRYGYAEITAIDARDPLAARFAAIDRLCDFERELYADAFVDDHLEASLMVSRITLGVEASRPVEHQLPLANARPGAEPLRANEVVGCASAAAV
jgi:hypothetical protein